MLYTVKYRRKGQIFWRTIKNVKGDGFVTDPGIVVSRWFVQDDESRLEIPIDAEFIFSKNRFFSILQNKKKETGVMMTPETNAKPE